MSFGCRSIGLMTRIKHINEEKETKMNWCSECSWLTITTDMKFSMKSYGKDMQTNLLICNNQPLLRNFIIHVSLSFTIPQSEN